MITLIYAVATLGAGIGVPCNIGRNVTDGLVGTLSDLYVYLIAKCACQKFHFFSYRHKNSQKAVVENLSGVKKPLGVYLFLELFQSFQAFLAENHIGLPGKVHTSCIGTTAIFSGGFHDSHDESEDKII